MKGFRVFPVLLLGLCCTATAQTSIYRDKPNSYVATNLMFTNIDGGAVSQTQGGLSVRMGGMLDENFGVEARFGRGLWHETQYFPTGDRIQLDVDHVAGLYGVARLPFSVPFVQPPVIDRMFVHALAGLADVQLRHERNVCSPICGPTRVRRSSALNFSWGLGMGVEIKLPETSQPTQMMPQRLGLSLEYMNYSGFNDADVSGIEVGLMMFF
jgi:hypothetical protein